MLVAIVAVAVVAGIGCAWIADGFVEGGTSPRLAELVLIYSAASGCFLTLAATAAVVFIIAS